MNTSYSAISSWRLCQQQYDYRYIQRLAPKIEAPAPTLGRVLHRYLERYYNYLRSEVPPTAHKESLRMLRKEYTDELKGLALAAEVAGVADVALEMRGLLDKAVRIAERYYVVRGEADVRRKVLFVEQRLSFPLDDGITNRTVLDLVTEEPDGAILLWEHKTGKDLPPAKRRLKDLQTTLGKAMLEETKGIAVDGVRWNYLRSKEPTVPDLLKRGGLSRNKGLDTTWHAYEEQIKAHKLDPKDYATEKERLKGREEEAFFLRVTLPLLQDERVLLRDFVATAHQLQAVYESGVAFTPVRNIGLHCDWCPFNKLCEAVILGGTENELKARLFTRRERKEETRDAAAV